MITYLIEYCEHGKRSWSPIGVAGVENETLSAGRVLDRVRDRCPGLHGLAIRVRLFRRIPALCAGTDATGMILVIDD